MKKLIVACAMCAVLFSCTKGMSPKTDPIKVYEAVNDKLEPSAPLTVTPMAIKVTAAPVAVLENIEITESLSSKFIAYANSEKKVAEKSKGDASVNIIAGTYSISGDYIVLTVEGYEVKIPLNLAVTAITNILINGKEYAATALPIAKGETASVAGLCRTWVPVEYHTCIMSDGTVLYNKINKTATALQKDLFKYVLGREPETSDLIFTSELEEYIFTNNKTALVKMSGNQYEVCTWSMEAADKFRFTLNSRSFVATPYFEAGSPNVMHLVIDIATAFEGHETDLDVDVTGRLVITLHD